MPSDGIVEPVFIPAKCVCGLLPGLEAGSPHQFRFDGLEYSFHPGVVEAITLYWHLHLQGHSWKNACHLRPAAFDNRTNNIDCPVRMVDQARRWLTYDNGPFQGSDGQIILQPVTSASESKRMKFRFFDLVKADGVRKSSHAFCKQAIEAERETDMRKYFVIPVIAAAALAGGARRTQQESEIKRQ